MIEQIFVSQTDLAAFINLSARRVRDLESQGVFSREENRKYDLQKCNHGFIDYLREQIANPSFNDAKARREVAKAALAELDVQERRGNLVPKDQALGWLSLIVGTAKANLWGIAKRLAIPMAIATDPKEAEEQIRSEIRRVLEDMGRPLKKGRSEKK